VFDVPKSAILNDPTETLIRRGRWKNKPKNTAFVFDQKTERWRPPAAVFLPRPQKDRSLSVNIESSLLAANLPSDWGVDHENFYAVRLTVGSCANHGLLVARDPVEGNPHHGAIMGIVELRDKDNDAFQSLVTDLAKQSEILSESLEIFELAKNK
jgi:hypothetical protein